MPYELYRQDKKVCVRNSETGESKGCSDTRTMAIKHMRALYAAEGGAKMGKKEVDELIEKAIADFDTEDTAEEPLHEKGYVPWGVTTFVDLDKAREAQALAEHAYSLTDDFMGLIHNVMTDETVSDKSSAVKQLADQFSSRVGQTPDSEYKSADSEDGIQLGTSEPIPGLDELIEHDGNHASPEDNRPLEGDKKELNILERFKEAVKELIAPLLPKEQPAEEKQNESPLSSDNTVMFYKEADGSVRWLARYSNNIRDDDRPREIISSKSHMRFVDLVDKGKAQHPQLWVWHVPEWKLGQATWVAYDDTGFSLAAGIVDKDMEPVAEYISKQKVCLSHGMPVASIRRDEGDPTVIVEHITKEISILPEWAAANKFTSFIVLDDKNKESDMAIPKDKVEALTRVWGEEAQKHLQALEQHNALDAEKATEEGRDTKEVTEEVVETPAVAETTAAETPSGETRYTQEEIAEAFANVVAPYRDRVEEIGAKLDQVATAIEGLTKEISHLKENDTAKIEQVVTQTPAASLAAMIAKNMGMSAVGSPETKVDGRSELGRSHPKEAPANVQQRTGIPFIDQMLAEPEKVEGD